MKKSHTLLLIENGPTVKYEFQKRLEGFFKTIIKAKNEQEVLSFYLHYKPDAIILETATLEKGYEKFVEKIRKNSSSPTIVMVKPHEIKALSSSFDYNFTYCMVDNNFEVNLYNCLTQTIQKIDLIKELTEYQSLGNVNDLRKYEENINQTNVPTILCTGNIDNVRCNDAFSHYFGINQDEINQNVLTRDFLNRVELKEIIEKKDLCCEHEIEINSKKLKSKIYILRQYELYLITFNSISNENNIIDLNLKQELEQIVDRIDKNFDNHVKLQYNMIEVTSQIRHFLQSDMEDIVIEDWLKDNHDTLQTIEQEFDYVILEELKMHTYLCAS